MTAYFSGLVQTLQYNMCRVIKVGESQKDNQVWTIQRHRQHWIQDTERKNNATNASQKTGLLGPKNCEMKRLCKCFQNVSRITTLTQNNYKA